MKNSFVLFSLFITLSMILFPNSASANGTSFYQESPYPPIGHVLPVKEGIVSIVKEDLIINITEEDNGGWLGTANPTMEADIQVIYEMQNETDKEMAVPVAFPQPGEAEQWEVTLDGKNVPLTGTVELSQAELTGDHHHTEWVHPRSGEKYEFGGYDIFENMNTLESTTFEVKLQADTIHQLKIDYQTVLGRDEKKSLHPVYRFDYLLHPASYWSAFNDLSIQVNAPAKSDVYINLPLKEEGSNTYTGEFPSLPEENLVLFLSPVSGIFIDLFHSRGKPLLFVIGLLAVYYAVMKLGFRKMKQKTRKWASLGLLGVLVLAALDILTHKIIGYPFTFLQYLFLFIYVLLLLEIWLRGNEMI